MFLDIGTGNLWGIRAWPRPGPTRNPDPWEWVQVFPVPGYRAPICVRPHGSCTLAKPPECALGGVTHSFHDLFLLALPHFPQFLLCTIIFSDSPPYSTCGYANIHTGSQQAPCTSISSCIDSCVLCDFLALMYVMSDCVWKYCTACSHVLLCCRQLLCQALASLRLHRARHR